MENIAKDRMDFLIESIHSTSELTAWQAMDSIYKVCDTNAGVGNDTRNGTGKAKQTKRKRISSVSRQPRPISASLSAAISSSSSSTCSPVPSPIIQQLPVIEPSLPVVSDYQWASSVSSQQTTIEAIPEDPLASIINETISNVEMEVVPQCSPTAPMPVHLPGVIMSQESLLQPQQQPEVVSGTMMNLQLPIDITEQGVHLPEENNQQTDLLDSSGNLQFADLSFQLGNDIIFYLSDENADLISGDVLDPSQVIIQHISVESDGYTHVTLESQKNFMEGEDVGGYVEEEVLPASVSPNLNNMNDCGFSNVIESQLAQC